MAKMWPQTTFSPHENGLKDQLKSAKWLGKRFCPLKLSLIVKVFLSSDISSSLVSERS